MSDAKPLKVQVSLDPGDTELYAEMRGYSERHRAGRLRFLAHLGALVVNGRLGLPGAGAPSPAPPEIPAVDAEKAAAARRNELMGRMMGEQE